MSLTPESLLILFVGFLAGTVNTVVGSGSLLTFPTLIALGYPPLIANVSNNIGLAPGSLSGAIGYRRELAGQRAVAIRLGVVAAVGGATGAALLLLLPASAFERIVPVLILVACGLVIAQPRLSALARARTVGPHERPGLDPLLPLAVGGTGVYGGYFGAAQGVILMALLGVLVDDDLQRINALKNVLTAIVNGTAAVIFALTTAVAWDAALLLAVGSVVGGQAGARLGRRIPPTLLRVVIVTVGLLVVLRYVLR
ncbi:MAG TPA: sulfite exporter TauE/SafE family protein [Methylomirabilota bacterium]|nr:sulfite exporter TauE/SafE family protein [Methylomirabilota bacterium]